MARGGGSVRAGCVYHVIPRFVAREWFIESSIERLEYLAMLGRCLARTDWRCFCYAVMSSHVHLGVVAGETPMAEWLRPLHTSFARWLNDRRQRIGAVFVKGPNVIQMRSQGVAHVIDYVHRNPVRAGLVTDAADSVWTSQRAYLNKTVRPQWLDVDLGLALARFESGADLAAWGAEAPVDRAELDTFRTVREAALGRPRQGVRKWATGDAGDAILP